MSALLALATLPWRTLWRAWRWDHRGRDRDGPWEYGRGPYEGA